MSLLPPAPEPVGIMTTDGVRIASYDHGGDRDRPVVLAVHGFSSNAYSNWVTTGWVRELDRAGYRVVSFDQRGHGASDKPHEAAGYTMSTLVADVQAVLDTYLLDEVTFVGYSLGGRVGWHAAVALPHLIRKAVLGGIPDGTPLTRFRIDLAREYVRNGTPVDDRLTTAYLKMAESFEGNDLTALIALVEGMRQDAPTDPANPPQQRVLFATGSEDPILDASKRLAEVTPQGEFFEIPGRNHYNAPTSREFRDRALGFLAT